ncbi:MAG: hypothetical protein WB767_11805, partial [Nocardioides sp.]
MNVSPLCPASMTLGSLIAALPIPAASGEPVPSTPGAGPGSAEAIGFEALLQLLTDTPVAAESAQVDADSAQTDDDPVPAPEPLWVAHSPIPVALTELPVPTRAATTTEPLDVAVSRTASVAPGTPP